MYRSKTYVKGEDKQLGLSNEFIIDYLLNHNIVIDPNISNNPYFQYNLFKVFDVLKQNDIKNITVKKGFITVCTMYKTYTINLNSDGGLTLAFDEKSNDGRALFDVNRQITTLVPHEEGMVIIKHQEALLADITTFSGNYEEKLQLTYINADGLVDEEKTVSIVNHPQTDFFSYRLNIEPLTKKEYFQYFKNMMRKENSIYNSRIRDSYNPGQVCDEKSGKNKDERYYDFRYFGDNDLLDIIEVGMINGQQEKKCLTSQDVLEQLQQIIVKDEVVVKLLKSIGKRYGLSNVNIRCFPSNEDESVERKKVNKFLASEKSLMYI